MVPVYRKRHLDCKGFSWLARALPGRQGMRGHLEDLARGAGEQPVRRVVPGKPPRGETAHGREDKALGADDERGEFDEGARRTPNTRRFRTPDGDGSA